MRKHLRWIIALTTIADLVTPVTGHNPHNRRVTHSRGWASWCRWMPQPNAHRKSRVAYQEALSELKQFKAGEPVWVVWSGVSDHSEAVRQFRRPEANRKITETLVMPAALVSPEATHQYVTLRVKVPEAGLAAIKSVKPGEWVTVTSRHRPANEAERWWR